MNAGHIKQMTLARQLYSPSVESIRLSLPDVGSSLDTACCELAHDLTLDRLDRLSAQLNAAQTSLQHLRKAMVAKRSTGHGTG